MATKYNKRIIPILHIQPDGEIEKEIHPEIGKYNWLMMRQDMDASLDMAAWKDRDDFKASFNQLTALLASHQEYVKNHRDILSLAINWEKHHRRNQYLLEGDERIWAEEWMNRNFDNELPPCAPACRVYK